MQPNQTAVMNYLRRELADYRLKFIKRPDSALIMELRSNQGKRLPRRVIAAEDQFDAHYLRALVQRVRRDLLLDAGPLDHDQAHVFTQGSQLPTFIPNQACRERKVVMAGARLRARRRV